MPGEISSDVPYPSTDEDEQPSKRAKVFRACAQCVSSKTRCEDVKPKGCWLCRRKRKVCSLAGAIPDSSNTAGPSGSSSRGASRAPPQQPTTTIPALIPHPPSIPPSMVAWDGINNNGNYIGGNISEGRISESERRIAALELELKELRTVLPTLPVTYDHSQPFNTLPTRPIFHPSSSSTPQNLNGSTSSIRGHSKITHLSHYAQLEDFSETIFSLGTADAYPSVLSCGILSTQSEIDIAFQSFKHHFSTILPLSPFLSIGTPSPTHNFVILAALHHVPMYASRRLAPLVDESLLVALSGNVSFEVVLALLILALAPVLPSENGDRARPTPLRLISLAYQFGRDLGLDTKVEGFLERGETLAEPFWVDSMQTVQMWTAVVNRYIMLHLLHGHGRPLPISPAPRIPISSNSIIHQTTLHLQDEYRLAEIARETVQHFIAIEAGKHEYDEVKQAMQRFQAGMEVLVEWKRCEGSPLLDLDQRCLEHIAVSRLSFLFQRIPSPLAPIRGVLIAGMNIFLVTAQRFLATLFPNPTTSSEFTSDPPMYTPHFLRPPSTQSFSSSHSNNNPLSPPLNSYQDLHFPAHVSMCATLAVLSLRGAVAHYVSSPENHKTEDITTLVNLPRLQRAEVYLRSLGGKTEDILGQADESFGTLEDFVRSIESRNGGVVRDGNGGMGGIQAGGDEVNMGQNSSGNNQAWGGNTGFGDGALLGAGLFDFDLFSWVDPTLLNTTWMPGQTDQSPGQGQQGGGQQSAGAYVQGGQNTEPSPSDQERWVHALR